MGPVSTHPDVNCERCGTPVQVDWIDVSTLGDVEPVYVQGRRSACPTKGCGTSCPICHREPGDIHSGACAPIVLGKVGDATRVTREDCLAVIR